MTSFSAKNKKGTVIHRTTSETLRLGDEAISNQLRITTSTRKKSQVTSPSCSFQITGVMTRYDQEDESADDLDESHTDEISRVTDNETPSFSEDSRDDPSFFNQNSARQVEEVQPSFPITVEVKEEPRRPKNINDLGRFKVVKLDSMAPFSRGRWTCFDYSDESSEMPPSNWNTYCQPNYYTGSLLSNEQIPIYVPQNNDTMPFSSEFSMPNPRMSLQRCTSIDTVINNASLDSNQNKQDLANLQDLGRRPAEQYDDLNPEDEAAGYQNIGPDYGTTIDTKIEHALDVVKNHLTQAVRLEVEELKIKICELCERITYLEYENDLLRSTVTPDIIRNLGNENNENQIQGE